MQKRNSFFIKIRHENIYNWLQMQLHKCLFLTEQLYYATALPTQI